MENTTLIYIYLAIAIVLTNLPLIGNYFALANTLIHEVCHLVFCILTNGKPNKISLQPDASGVAITESASWFARIIVSYAGYTGSSLAAVGLFYALSKGYYEFIFYFFMGLSVISLLFWVRNFYGVIWTISFISLFAFTIYKEIDFLIVHLSIFLSCIVLVQSIFTAFIILKLSFKQRKNAGDATNLAKATFIPAIIWGAVFFAQSLYAGHFIVTNYFV